MSRFNQNFNLAATIAFIVALMVVTGLQAQSPDLRTAGDVQMSKLDNLIDDGRKLLSQGQTESANLKFKKALSESTDFSHKFKAVEGIADTYLAQDDVCAAIKSYEYFISDSSISPDTLTIAKVYRGLGRIYYREESYFKAIKSFRFAESLISSNIKDSLFASSLYTDMTRTLLEAGDLNEALSLIHKSEALSPKGATENAIEALSIDAKIESLLGNSQVAYQKMAEANELCLKFIGDRKSFQSINSGYICDDNVSEQMSQEMDELRTMAKQSDSLRRNAFIFTFVMGFALCIAVVCFSMTFNRLKFYQDKIAALEAKLGESQRVISIIAHDSTNQFTSLLGLANVLVERSKHCDSEAASFSRRVYTSALTLFQTMNNLLAWSKTREQLKPRACKVYVADCVADCVTAANASLSEKDISFTYNIPENLTATVDPSHIEIILRNIISNAIKYSERGGKVFIKAMPFEKRTIITVQDEGSGMPPEEIQRFNNNQNILSFEGSKERCGIGLTICRDLAKCNDGSVVFEPGRKVGTSVTIILPS